MCDVKCALRVCATPSHGHVVGDLFVVVGRRAFRQPKSTRMEQTKRSSAFEGSNPATAGAKKPNKPPPGPKGADLALPPLPPNWNEVPTETGEVYFWNDVTDEVAWERPTASAAVV